MTTPKSFHTPPCRKGIHTVEDLRCHLQVALELEHSTIPPYLCALYSIPDGKNVTASTLIRSVVMEEMLHMVLVANLLNAIGGEPKVDSPTFIPAYPTYLPNSSKAFKVHLLPFGKEALEIFMRIEQPTPAGGEPDPDHYDTIGEFYAAIRQGFETLEAQCARRGESLFTGDPARQVDGRSWYYGGGGEPIMVHDMASAKRAILEITEQGEGFDGTMWDDDTQFGQVDELAHFYRFVEIDCERRYQAADNPKLPPTGDALLVDWKARYPMMADPKMEYFADQPDIHAMMLAFNTRYSELLRALHAAFNGAPAALMGAVPIMYDMKYRAQALMAVPTGRGDGRTVGPSFEFVGGAAG
jgi:hypothetical protein